jgi:thymidine kinase
MENMAKLHFIYGCMGSSKSLRLLALAHNLKEKGVEFVLMKPSKDTRDGTGIVKSRAGLEMPCISIDNNLNIYEYVKTYKLAIEISDGALLRWVLIDECQFLEPEQVDQLADIVDFLGVNVMCYGLRTDFMSHLFPGSKRLFELADELSEVKSYCNCGDHKASINARISENGEIVTEGHQIMVGGDSTYQALCRKCWKKRKKQQK